MNEPIRILHIVTTMNRGGLETMLMNYYRNIDRNKVQFDFLTHREFEFDYESEIRNLGGNIYHLPQLNPFSLVYRKKLKDFFEKHSEYRIVHVHLDCMSSLPLYYAKRVGIKVRIAHSHNSNQEKNLKYIFKLFYKRRISKYATDLYSCGYKAGKWMFGDNEFRVLNNAIDAEVFKYDMDKQASVRKKLDIEGKFIVGHVGRFSVQKNHMFLLEVFKDLYSINLEAVLVLVGTGELMNDIKEKVNEYHLNNNVIFLGNCSNVNELYQSFDVFVFPSLFEGLPVTMIEAQASGLKCIISDMITDECVFTDNVIKLSLNESSKVWAKTINEFSYGYVREDTCKLVKNAKYDVKENAKKLGGYYCNEYEKCIDNTNTDL